MQKEEIWRTKKEPEATTRARSSHHICEKTRRSLHRSGRERRPKPRPKNLPAKRAAKARQALQGLCSGEARLLQAGHLNQSRLRQATGITAAIINARRRLSRGARLTGSKAAPPAQQGAAQLRHLLTAGEAAPTPSAGRKKPPICLNG